MFWKKQRVGQLLFSVIIIPFVFFIHISSLPLPPWNLFFKVLHLLLIFWKKKNALLHNFLYPSIFLLHYFFLLPSSSSLQSILQCLFLKWYLFLFIYNYSFIFHFFLIVWVFLLHCVFLQVFTFHVAIFFLKMKVTSFLIDKCCYHFLIHNLVRCPEKLYSSWCKNPDVTSFNFFATWSPPWCLSIIILVSLSFIDDGTCVSALSFHCD